MFLALSLLLAFFGLAGSTQTDVLVVGAGLSGATTAFYLHKSGLDVLVAEGSDRSGGNIASKRNDEGFVWEEGPNTFQPSIPFLRFCKDLRISEDIVYADAKSPRYIYWNNELHPLPMSFQQFLGTRLLSWSAKLRLVLGLIGFTHRRVDSHTEESVKEFALRNFGQEVYDRIVDPFISGIYAGDAGELSLSAALPSIYAIEEASSGKGLLWGLLKSRTPAAKLKRAKENSDNADLYFPPSGSLGSFRGGMQTMIDAVDAVLGDRILLNHKLLSIRKLANNNWQSVVTTPSGNKTIESKSIVLTVPAAEASKLLMSIVDSSSSLDDGESRSIDEPIEIERSRDEASGDGAHLSVGPQPPKRCEPLLPEAALLQGISYPPIWAAVLAYPNEYLKRPLDGFGHLLPRKSGIRSLGTIWVSSLFPYRSPASSSLVCTFIGGCHDKKVEQLTQEEVLQQAHEDLQHVLLRPNAPKPRVLGMRHWRRAIPQYDIGHTKKIAMVENAIQLRAPGLYLAGNFKGGVALGDCINLGKVTAQSICGFLGSDLKP